jgi:hypothetical protein
MARQKAPIKKTDTSYDRIMAEAVAEYKAWVKSRQKIRYKQVIDYILPVTGSDNPLMNVKQRLRTRGAKV